MKNVKFNESLIDFIVESENNQDKSSRTIKNKVEKKISNIPETNNNELELKSNDNVNYSNQKKINTVEKPLRRHGEYLDYRLNTNKIAGNKKEKSCPALNIQLTSSKNTKIDYTSLGNQSDKSIEKIGGKGNKNHANTFKK